jgi:hypothetical protein
VVEPDPVCAIWCNTCTNWGYGVLPGVPTYNDPTGGYKTLVKHEFDDHYNFFNIAAIKINKTFKDIMLIIM